jgi:hypothetical protein
MTKYYIAFLGKLKQQLVSKHRGKLWKGILSLQDNVAPLRAAIAHQKLANLLCEFVKHLKGRKFSSIEAATLAADG